MRNIRVYSTQNAFALPLRYPNYWLINCGQFDVDVVCLLGIAVYGLIVLQTLIIQPDCTEQDTQVIGLQADVWFMIIIYLLLNCFLT